MSGNCHPISHLTKAVGTLCSSAVLALLWAAGASATPGDLVAQVPLAVPGDGVSVATDCTTPLPNIFYTIASTTNLYRMDKTGANLGSVPIATASGAPVQIDEIAYDRVNALLYGCEHGTSPINIWKIDPGTGLATFGFTSSSSSVGTYRDGIAVDATDQTLWVSGDVSTTIEHYTTAGGFLGQITPTDAGGNVLGSISGVQVGIGDLLYLGRNGFGQIVQVRKSDGGFISSFASPGGRDEGLECDPISYAPKLVLWSRDFFSPGFVDAIELEAGTCACGGITPNRTPTWGEIKIRYR